MRWINWVVWNKSTARERWKIMRQNLCFKRRFLVALPFAFILLVSASAPEKHLSVYSTAATYSLTIVPRQGRDYIGLLELLDPLGTVSAKSDSKNWHLRYNNILAEFVVGNSHARVQGRDADLTGKFLMENGRGLVPLSSLGSLLPRFLGGPATLHQESGRLFIGSVGTHFTASVAADDPSRLIFHFTAPVNPTVAAEAGKVRMTFNRDPVTAPASPTLTFGSKTIPEAIYSEGNGSAEITVTTTLPLIATFSPDGRSIILAPAKSQPTPAVAANPSTPAAPQNTAPAAPAPQRRYFAVVDASHGGDDRGEALSPTLAEKDVTLALARRLRQELENRGMPTLILRDSDATVSLDERASSANATHAAVYVVLHAASNGHGVRLYTALLPASSDEDRGPFHSWTTAQQSSIPMSQAAAASVAAELKKRAVEVRTLVAPLRPLNNVVTAAVAVEIAPPAADLSDLISPDYEQLIASSVAAGIANIRTQLGDAP
jgi:N-acetylmuramoyl-L-alanine amidase